MIIRQSNQTTEASDQRVSSALVVRIVDSSITTPRHHLLSFAYFTLIHATSAIGSVRRLSFRLEI